MNVRELIVERLQHPKPNQCLPQGFNFMEADIEFRRITTGDEFEVAHCVLDEGKIVLVLKTKKVKK